MALRIMKSKLDKTKVRNWLRGHRKASSLIERERFRSLVSLTADESAAIYQSMAIAVIPSGDRPEPSPILWQMRKALRRYSKQTRKRTG